MKLYKLFDKETIYGLISRSLPLEREVLAAPKFWSPSVSLSVAL